MFKRCQYLCLVAFMLSSPLAFAGVRHFTFLYEATTSAPGSVELENSVTFRTGTDGNRFSEVDFRHEIEMGLTKQFQLSLYVADWNYHSGFPEQSSGYSYSATAVEGIYNLTSPVDDPVGVSVYQEVRGGYQLFESESKIILQKNFGPFIAAYNATLEATWEGQGLHEHEGELSQALGVSYEFTPAFSVGIEMLHEIVLPEWAGRDAVNNFFIGPNASFRHASWFATITALAQATQTSDEPDVQIRTIIGFAF
jgi:hypothetical protein